jgi:hypothetical protein
VNSTDSANGALFGEPEGAETGGVAENVEQRLQVEESASTPVGVNGAEPEEQPGELRWSKARHEIRVAATKYSEDTHADY